MKATLITSPGASLAAATFAAPSLRVTHLRPAA
jgi:hypothetical protein